MRSEQHLHYGPSAEGDGSLDRVLPSPLQRRTHSLSWPNPWTGAITSPVLMGNQVAPVGTATTGTIPAGGFQILEFQWAVPNPMDYSMFGTDMKHFCLLARINEPGVTLTETTDLWNNVKNNNNIAWKNIAIENINTGDDRNSDVLVGNYTKEKMNVNLVFNTTFEEKILYERFKSPVTIELNEKLFNKWYESNKAAIDAGKYKNMFNVDKYSITLYNGNASLNNILLEPREFYSIKVKFNGSHYKFNREEVVKLHVTQTNARTNNVIGGELFKFLVLPRK